MKKLLCVFLIIVMIFSFSGCFSMLSDVADEVKEPSNVEADTDENTENVDADADADLTEDDAPDLSGEVTVEEKVLLDEADVKITATGLENEPFFGPELKLLIENNTDTDLTFQARNVSVNGYMVENLMSVDVAAGKKANDVLTLMETDLEMCGIETIGDIELQFHVFSFDDWEDYLESDTVRIETSAFGSFEYTYDDSGDLLYEAEGVKIVAKGLSENDSIFGPGLIVYIHNDSDRVVTVQVRDVSVNGFMIDTIFSQDVAQGKHAISAITFFDESLEENGIESIDEMEMYFHIYDFDNWDTVAESDIISITF